MYKYEKAEDAHTVRNIRTHVYVCEIKQYRHRKAWRSI